MRSLNVRCNWSRCVTGLTLPSKFPVRTEIQIKIDTKGYYLRVTVSRTSGVGSILFGKLAIYTMKSIKSSAIHELVLSRGHYLVQ